MGNRAAVTVIVAVTFVIWMGSRATAIALPLVALEQTGQEWTMGLVLGAQALPLVTVGMWGARLRDRLTSGRAVATVMAAQVAGLAVVPVAAASGRLGIAVLIVSGIVVGAAAALEGPAIRALLSDLGDGLGPGWAAKALTLQDLAHRCTMFLAPPLGALAVGHGHTMTLLWSECVAVAVGATFLTMVSDSALRREHRDSGTESGPGTALIRTVLRAYPRMTASMVVHATVSLTWFAFSLGLAIVGARTDRPGELIAAGMTGYGLASTATSLVAPWLVNRVREWPTAVTPTVVLGAVFVAMPSQFDSLVGVIALAALGGLAMPLGIGAHNRILATDPPPGPNRRAGFAADQIADGGASAVGMFAGGAVIATVGASTTFVVAGALQILAALAAITIIGWRR